MSPWWIVAGLVALINFAAFVAVRGRWGRIAPLLVVAAAVGTVIGDAVGSSTRLDPVRIGDFSALAASAGAQLAMIATLLLSTMGPPRRDDPAPPR